MSGMIGEHGTATPLVEVPFCSAGIPRAVALLAVTVMYVIGWSQAVPNQDLVAARALVEPNMCLWRPVAQPWQIQLATTGGAKTPAETVSLETRQIGPSLELRVTHKSLTADELLPHVAQLPMGLPTGEYQILQDGRELGVLDIMASQGLVIESPTQMWHTSAGGISLEFCRKTTLVAEETAAGLSR